MRTIELKAKAKINLSLDVLGVRKDGYHEVKMIMQSLELSDDIILSRSEGGISLETDSCEIPLDENNICWKAAKLMFEEYKLKGGLDISVKKNIPVAAGLAGGSTDAAAVIKGINRLFELGLSEKELMEQGVKTGADVPFCIMGGTALSEGIGEKLTGLKNLPKCGIILFKPKIDVSTAGIYKKLDNIAINCHPDVDGMIKTIDEGDLKGTAGLMGNVLELVTAASYPVIKEIEKMFMEAGALGSMMSGSGPTVFGIFGDDEQAKAGYDTLKSRLPDGQLILTRPS